MEQLPLFAAGELKPVREYLHVWSEATRAALVKKPGAEALGSGPDNRVEETFSEKGAHK